MRRWDPEESGYLAVPAGIDACLDRGDPRATARALAAGGYDVQWRYMRWNPDAARAMSAPIDVPPVDTQIYMIDSALVGDTLDDDTRSILVTVTSKDDAIGVNTTVRPGRLRAQPDR